MIWPVQVREHRRRPSGFSLLELTAVVALIGILAAVGLARFGQNTLINIGAQSDARRIALDLTQAQRRAISTGDNHYLAFTPGTGPVVSYALYRRSGSGDTVVEATREVPTGVVVMPSHPVAEFTFEGTALAAYSITVAGADRTYTISVVPSLGSVQVNESP